MDLSFERHYPHPIDEVWQALTSSEALGRWLMRNDFKAESGHACVFRFCAEGNNEESLVYVTVEELRAPVFMRWRWRNEDEPGETTVTFELEEKKDGTLLRIRHAGKASPRLAKGLEQGWPTKLGDLAEVLSSSA